MRLASAVVATLALAFLAGCVDMRTQVAQNGAASSTIVVAVSPAYREMVRDYLSEHYPRWNMTERAREDGVDFVLSRTYGSNETLQVPKAGEETARGGVYVEIERHGVIWYHHFTDMTPLPEVEGPEALRTAGTIPVSYTLVMPGPIREASAGATVNGDTATWQFTLAGHDAEISATSRLSQLPRLLILLACVAGLLAGYIFVARARR